MSRKQLALFEPTLVVQALKEAVKKLNPQAQWRNPVMFIVWIGSLLTTCISIAMLLDQVAVLVLVDHDFPELLLVHPGAGRRPQ